MEFRLFSIQDFWWQKIILLTKGIWNIFSLLLLLAFRIWDTVYWKCNCYQRANFYRLQKFLPSFVSNMQTTSPLWWWLHNAFWVHFLISSFLLLAYSPPLLLVSKDLMFQVFFFSFPIATYFLPLREDTTQIISV